MSVDTRAHITSNVLQQRAVLSRTHVGGEDARGHYARLKAISIQGHNGDDVRVSLKDLGAALRVLKISPAALGYTSVGRAAKS